MRAEDYFSSVAQDVFGDSLLALGARLTECGPLLVRYEAKNWFIELLALASDGPRYSPRVEIGPLPERGIQTVDKQVDVCRTAPVGSPLRRYNLTWRYSDPEQMREAFAKVRDEVFEPFALPYLSNPSFLTDLVIRQSVSVRKQHGAEVAAHNQSVHRAKASAALAAGDDAEYLRQMDFIAPDQQSKSERARIEYLRKRTRS